MSYDRYIDMHHHFQHFFGRHRGHHQGFGHIGRGFMDGGMGGRGFGMGRKLASADLQLLILRLLDEKPRHGYEIIKALDELSNGFYVPSPGMVYPALTYLEEIGHATVAAEGARKQYSITDSGKEHLQKNAGTAEAMLAQFGRVGERMERVRRAFDSDASGEDISESGADHRRGSKELKRALHELRSALSEKRHSSRDEQQRIAEVLQRACAEIAGAAK
jgi:DNA-binding PadR family transcriptional regulator